MDLLKIKDNLPNDYFNTIVKTVDETLKDVKYGMFDKDGNEIENQEDWYEETRIQPTEFVIKNKRGNCVDQVNLEYWMFKDAGIDTFIYYIEYTNKKETPAHMFIVLKNFNDYYWYEHAWEEEKGLHKYNSLQECLQDIKEKFCPVKFNSTCKVYKIKSLKEGENPNQSLQRKIIELKDSGKLYYLSEKKIGDMTVVPTIPNNLYVELGFADSYQERISLYPSIEQCLYNFDENQIGKVYNVYIPDCDFKLYKPKISEIPQVNLTNEIWSMSPLKMKNIGKIKVVSEVKDNDLTFKYGDNNVGELRKWNYKFLDDYSSEPRVQSMEELQRNIRRKHPDWKKEMVYNAAFDIRKKQIKKLNEYKELLKEKKNNSKKEQEDIYVVVDYNGKVITEGNLEYCQNYKEEHSNETLALCNKKVLPKLTRTEVKELFEDSKPKGLNIEYNKNRVFDCYEINVIDSKSNKVIDQELCYNKEDIKEIIDWFKSQYKINKVKKERE